VRIWLRRLLVGVYILSREGKSGPKHKLNTQKHVTYGDRVQPSVSSIRITNHFDPERSAKHLRTSSAREHGLSRNVPNFRQRTQSESREGAAIDNLQQTNFRARGNKSKCACESLFFWKFAKLVGATLMNHLFCRATLSWQAFHILWRGLKEKVSEVTGGGCTPFHALRPSRGRQVLWGATDFQL